MKKEHIDKKTDFKINYFWISMIFVFIQIVVIFRNYLTNFVYFFWFCDFVPILFALAFFFKKEQAVKAIINFGLFVQFGFLVGLIAGQYSSELVFSPFLNFVYMFASILLHFSVIFALILTYKIKPNLRTVYFSIMLIIAIYAVTLIFTSQADNVNKVNLPGGIIAFNIPYFTFLWPIITFVLLVLPAQGLQYLLYRFSLRKSRKN